MVSLRLVAAPTWMPENDYQATTRIVVSGEGSKIFLGMPKAKGREKGNGAAGSVNHWPNGFWSLSGGDAARRGIGRPSAR